LRQTEGNARCVIFLAARRGFSVTRTLAAGGFAKNSGCHEYRKVFRRFYAACKVRQPKQQLNSEYYSSRDANSRRARLIAQGGPPERLAELIGKGERLRWAKAV
jgi:hypothetical protein